MQGLQGIKGLQGIEGIQGTQGEQGIQGEQGTNGKNGLDSVGNNGDNNSTKEHVVKHSVTLSGIDANTFNADTKVIESFTATVAKILDVSSENIQNVRAIAKNKDNVRRFLSSTDECNVLYELSFDNKEKADATEKNIEDPNGLFQSDAVFMSAFKSTMKQKNVDLSVTNSITSTKPAALASIDEENGDINSQANSGSNDATDVAFTNEKDSAVGLTILGVLSLMMAIIAIIIAVISYNKRKETGEHATSDRLLLDENIELEVLDDSPSVSMSSPSSKKRTAHPLSKKSKLLHRNPSWSKKMKSTQNKVSATEGLNFEKGQKDKKKNTQNKRLFGSQGSFTIDNPAAQVELTNMSNVASSSSSTSEGKWKQNELNIPSISPTHHSRTSTELPDGWAKLTTDTGSRYYGNSSTQESAWAPPPGSTGGSAGSTK